MSATPTNRSSSKDTAKDIGEAATLPASMDGSADAPLHAPSPAVDIGTRAEVLSALFDAAAVQTRMGRYVIQGTLGTGGMGTVLEATDPGLDRKVALKVLHRELDERHTNRLRREAQALAKLSHPNVVQVYEVGEVDGQTFVAMEKVTGQTLRDWVRQTHRPDWRECVEVYLQVIEGLVAAHEEGLVHRDFKPANAIIDGKGRVRVLDFGLARRVDELDDADEDSQESKYAKTEPEQVLDVSLTKTGAVLGTPAYMPPEQMRGEEADGRSDQFSFCVSLFEAVYGERPFAGKSLPELLTSMARDEVRPTPKGSSVPGRLRSVLVRGLASNPQERWPSMEELQAQLRDLVAPRRSRWLVAGVIGLVGVLTTGGVAVGLALQGDDVPATARAEPGPVDGAEQQPAPSEDTRPTPQEQNKDVAESVVPPDGAREAASVDSGTGDSGDSGDEPEVDPTGQAESPSPAVQPRARRKKPKRAKTDRSLRKKFERQLKKCGDQGTIEITATLVRKTGELSRPKVKVLGAGANKAAVEQCANKALKSFTLPPRDKETTFERLSVQL